MYIIDFPQHECCQRWVATWPRFHRLHQEFFNVNKRHLFDLYMVGKGVGLMVVVNSTLKHSGMVRYLPKIYTKFVMVLITLSFQLEQHQTQHLPSFDSPKQ